MLVDNDANRNSVDRVSFNLQNVSGIKHQNESRLQATIVSNMSSAQRFSVHKQTNKSMAEHLGNSSATQNTIRNTKLSHNMITGNSKLGSTTN